LKTLIKGYLNISGAQRTFFYYSKRVLQWYFFLLFVAQKKWRPGNNSQPPSCGNPTSRFETDEAAQLHWIIYLPLG